MKCALVVPAWTPEEIFSAKTAGSQVNYWQPLGTLYVAASLREAGHEVIFLNGAFLGHEEIMGELRAFAPEAVGLYSTTFGWDKARHAARSIKALLPGVFVFVGGPYPIAARGGCLEDEPGFIDAVVTGEGEETSVEMLERLGAGRSLQGVRGVAFRDGGTVVENALRELMDDLDALPFPARDLLGDAARYVPPPATYRRKPVAVMITSRGCNRRCLYCFQIDRHRTKGIRYRSVQNVMAEVELCLEQGYREIKFIDDTLAADYGRAMDIAGEIKRRGLDFTWFASACVNQVDAPLLRAFKDAGCWAILFGAESGVQKNLNAIRKGITLEQTRRAVRAAKDAGLMVLTPFLFGIPGETYEEGLRTIEFAMELDPDVANFHAITPFPGTELYENIEQYGSMSGDLRDFTYQGIAFTPHTMSREQVAQLRQIAFRRFYSRPRYLARRLLGVRSLGELRAGLSGARSLFWLWARKGLFRREGPPSQEAPGPRPPHRSPREAKPWSRSA
ncbi:MAG: radical SAM protein [Nitrospirota bacterium]